MSSRTPQLRTVAEDRVGKTVYGSSTRVAATKRSVGRHGIFFASTPPGGASVISSAEQGRATEEGVLTMLVLTRKAGEQIVVPECEVTITVLKIKGKKIRLGISAPAEVAVHRGEIWRRICRDIVGIAPDSE